MHLSSRRTTLSKIATTSATVLLAGALVLVGQSANAATAAPAVSDVVVKPGGQASIPLKGIAANSTSATLKITASGAWRDTTVTGCLTNAPVAGCKETRILVAKAGSKTSTTLTIPVKGTARALKVSNSRASVRLQVQVVSQVAAKPAAVKPPVATAPVVKPPVATAPVAPVAPKPAVKPGKPSAANTGVPAGTKLTKHNGNIVVTKPGTVIDSLDVQGSVVVKAANVTIKNSILRGNPTSPNGTLVNNLAKHKNLVVTDSELVNANAAVRFRGIMGSDFTAIRLNIHGVEDQLHLTGGNVKLIDSYLHDNFYLEKDPLRNYTPTHDDSIQIQAGTNIVMTGNTIVDAHNAVVMITQDRGDVGNVTFANNYADGGGCTINVAEKSYGPIMGMSITNNVFGRTTKNANCAIIAPVTTKIVNSGNVYTDGVAVAIRKG